MANIELTGYIAHLSRVAIAEGGSVHPIQLIGCTAGYGIRQQLIFLTPLSGSIECPYVHTLLQLRLRQPNFTSHRPAVRSDNPPLSSSPRVGKMRSLRARWNFDGVTSPVPRLVR